MKERFERFECNSYEMYSVSFTLPAKSEAAHWLLPAAVVGLLGCKNQSETDKKLWTSGGLNAGLLACKASTLPLSYMPDWMK